jgi:hypothetical protein
MKIAIEVEHKIGDIVYLRTDTDQDEHIVTSYIVTSKDVLYEIARGSMTTTHYDFEICTDKELKL